MRLLSINTHSIIEKNYDEKTKNFLEHIAKLQPDIIAMHIHAESACVDFYY